MSFSFNSNSNKELLIRSLVDDIYQIEEKINSIYYQINKNEQNDTFIQKIEALKNCRNSLIQKKIKLNNTLISKIKINSDIIQEKLNLLEDIDNNINSMKNELISNFNTLSFKSLKLKKYILLNKSDGFLSEQQINDIILEPSIDSKNVDVQKLKREIAINKASQCVVINNYNEIKAKIAQIEENLKMLKEEKMTIKYELINLISCKESLESIIKLNINQLNIHNKLINEKEEKNKNNDEENQNINIWTKPNELFIYELMAIDSRKAANSICNQLFNLFNINNEGENKNNETINEINNRNFKKNKTINSNKTVDNYNFNINDINQNNSLNEIFHNKFKNKDNYESMNNYNSIYLKYNYMSINNANNSNIYSILDKKTISHFIQNELEKFISGEIYSYKTIYEFLENLSIIIISKFQYANIIISADTLTIYLSYTFKSLYYDSIINSKLQFINKDYKAIKKNFKKIIPFLYSELPKLDNKYQEYISKIQIFEKQIKFVLKEKSQNKKVKLEKVKLSMEEQNYIQICFKANGLIKQKKNIEKAINEYENKKNELIQDNELMINKINDEIESIDNEIVQLNKEIKDEKNKANKDIEYYKNIINEKKNIIKEQLQIYKDKYGSNLDIYNRLINSINNTIKRSHDKEPLIIINNNNNINNSNIYSYDINNNISRNKDNISFDQANRDNNKDLKELILFQNDDNIINNEYNDENNINKELFNIGLDISKIEKSPYVRSLKSKDSSNLSINNISLNNQIEKNRKPSSLREQNIKKVNERRRATKALSNVESFYKLNNKNPSFEFISNTNKLKNKNNSINTEIRDNKNKTFYSSSISGKTSSQKKNEGKEKINSIGKTNNSSIIDNINCPSERRLDKYNKYYNNYYKKKSKILSYNNSNNNSMNKQKYQSYSFINKSTRQIIDSVSNKKRKGSNFHNSITKKKLGLFTYKEETNSKKSLNNSINNNSINFLNIKELNKLTNTLQNLKDTITQRSKIPYNSSNFKSHIHKTKKFLEKMKFLTKPTFCYFRIYNNNCHKFNPLLDITSNYLCLPPYNFNPANIILNGLFNQIGINPINDKLENIELNILDIENTIVSSKIKTIIEVHRNFRKYKESSKFKTIEDFVEKQMPKNPQLTGGEIEKCAKNQNFNFSLLIKGGKLIELIICSYEEFKQWINGLAYLIKNKNILF